MYPAEETKHKAINPRKVRKNNFGLNKLKEKIKDMKITIFLYHCLTLINSAKSLTPIIHKINNNRLKKSLISNMYNPVYNLHRNI